VLEKRQQQQCVCVHRMKRDVELTESGERVCSNSSTLIHITLHLICISLGMFAAPCLSHVRIGDALATIPTPALILDLNAFLYNLKKLPDTLKQINSHVHFRPHAKAHKCPIIAQQQILSGAVGVCVQKVENHKHPNKIKQTVEKEYKQTDRLDCGFFLQLSEAEAMIVGGIKVSFTFSNSHSHSHSHSHTHIYMCTCIHPLLQSHLNWIFCNFLFLKRMC
jgi:hypothetical protein